MSDHTYETFILHQYERFKETKDGLGRAVIVKELVNRGLGQAVKDLVLEWREERGLWLEEVGLDEPDVAREDDGSEYILVDGQVMRIPDHLIVERWEKYFKI